MAVYKIFPEKDSFIWSEQQTQNMGRDEILDISTYNDPDIVNSNLSFIPSVTRALIKFPQSQIDPLLDEFINIANTSSNWDVLFNLYLANASNLPQTYTLQCNAISQSWEMGTGRLSDRPRTSDGVSWTYRLASSSAAAWQTSSFQTNVTAYDNGIPGQRGGGNWFIIPSSSQTFNYTSDKDIRFSVKPIIERWHSHSLHPGVYPEAFGNEGFIVRYTGSQEFNTSSIQQLSYFSMDTHTIYPPSLEIRWDDSSYITGSLPIVSASTYVISLGNNKGEYQQDTVQRFRVNVREKYPTRVFQTTSLYLSNKALPSSSYWSIKDLDTEEIVVDYDTSYTKVSCDSSGNYFDVYMNGLEPERYYKLLFKSVLSDGETIVSDNNYYFKVIR